MTAWEERMERVQTTIESWRERLQTPDSPASGSSLAGDNRVHPAMPLSQLAWWGLHVGVEHVDATLRLLSQQVETGGPILPTANYTVLRAGLVGASQAAVLLLPSNRAERTTYGLQIAREEYRQAVNLREHLLNYEGLLDEARRKALADKFVSGYKDQQAAVESLLDRRRAARSLSNTSMIERAAELVHDSGADASLLALGVEMEWRLGSGAAHGHLLMTLHRADSHVVDEQRTALTGTSYEQVAERITAVTLMLNQGWRSWDLRRI